MSNLIPSVSLNDFKKLSSSQIRKLKSCEITADGEYVCTVIIPGTDYIKVQGEYMGQLSNSVAGETLAQIQNK